MQTTDETQQPADAQLNRIAELLERVVRMAPRSTTSDTAPSRPKRRL